MIAVVEEEKKRKEREKEEKQSERERKERKKRRIERGIREEIWWEGWKMENLGDLGKECLEARSSGRERRRGKRGNSRARV